MTSGTALEALMARFSWSHRTPLPAEVTVSGELFLIHASHGPTPKYRHARHIDRAFLDEDGPPPRCQAVL